MVDAKSINPDDFGTGMAGASTANLQTMKSDLAEVALNSDKIPTPIAALSSSRAVGVGSVFSETKPVLSKPSAVGLPQSGPPPSLPVAQSDLLPVRPASKPFSVLADLKSRLIVKAGPIAPPSTPVSPVVRPAPSVSPPSERPASFQPIITPPPPRPIPTPPSFIIKPAARPAPMSETPTLEKPSLPVSSSIRPVKPPSPPPQEPILPSIEIEDDEEEGGGWNKRLIFIVAGIVVVVVGVAAFFLTGSAPEPVVKEPAPPAVVIPVYQEKDPLFASVTLNLRADSSRAAFFRDLASFNAVSGETGGFTKIVLIDSENKSLGLGAFLDRAGISLPVGALEPASGAILADDFIFYSYKNETGSDFVLAIPLARDVLSEEARQFLSEWERTFADDWLFLLKGLAEKAATIEFQNNSYRSVSLRYKNFPDSARAIDYAITENNYLLIASSRASMFKAIDATR